MNGRMLLDFVEMNNLSIINADMSICQGTFTWIVAHSSSVLDYVLVPEVRPYIKRLCIDKELQADSRK